MTGILAIVLLAAFWGLLWAATIWASADTRDGRDWGGGGSTTGRPSRIFD